MSATTFRNELADLVVSGVTRRYDQHPNIDAELGDLPAQWPRAIGGDHTFKTFSGKFVAAVRRAELVIAVRPGVMGTNAENYNDMLTLSDNLEGALDDDPLTGFRIQEYSIRFDPVEVGGTSYAAVIVEITAQEK